MEEGSDSETPPETSDKTLAYYGWERAKGTNEERLSKEWYLKQEDEEDYRLQ